MEPHDELDYYALKCPDLHTIFTGNKYFLWVKLGGELKLKDVMVTAVYQTGKKSHHADVFGYGFRRTVNVKKLRERVYGNRQ